MKPHENSLSKLVRRNALTLRIVRNSVIAIGGFIVAIGSAFMAASSWPPSAWQVAIFFGALFALLGGIIGAAVDVDPTEQIDNARRQAIEAEELGRLSESRLNKLKIFNSAVTELRSLYLLFNTCRSILETSLTSGKVDEVQVIKDCLDGCQHDLRVALSLEMTDYWTICVYRSELREDHIAQLRCVAHLRSVDCDVKNARVWRDGVGIAGVTNAKNEEVVEPDVFASTSGTSFKPSDTEAKPLDDQKYRSLLGVPITLADGTVPWGVVVATSSNALHFGNKHFEGLPPEEAIRALAGIFALAVAFCRLNTNVINES